MDNRRRDKRLLLPGLQIWVKARGRGDASSYVHCKAVDISFNGLAFTSTELDFELLQKIDLLLLVAGRILTGSAVVCDVITAEKGVRYGVLYIDINPPLEELFNLHDLTASQIQEMVVTIVDSLTIDKTKSLEQRLLVKAQRLLFDAVDAFKIRLCQCLGECIEVQGEHYQLASLFEFDTDKSAVTVPLKTTKGAVNRCKVMPEISNNQVYYKTDDNRSFKNIMEFMQELRDTFELMLR